MAKIVVLGQGYVGLPLALLCAKSGHYVVGYDVDEQLVKRITSLAGTFGDVSLDLLSEHLEVGSYVASHDPADLAGFDVAVIAVPTPLLDKRPDLSYIRSAIDLLAHHLTANSLVILESTTYPGTTEEVVGPLFEKITGMVAGRDYSLGFSPERIDPANRRNTLESTQKIVSGVTPDCLKRVREFYQGIGITVWSASSPTTAELAKLIENTYRHINIALVNELAILGGAMGWDVRGALEAAGTKPFGFARFNPGPGAGGHCIPIDPEYLSWVFQERLGVRPTMIEAASSVNDAMPMHVVERVHEVLQKRGHSLQGPASIVLLGMAYKANCGDIRESPAVVIAEQLLTAGHKVTAVDPYITDAQLPSELLLIRDFSGAAVEAADIVVLVTDHDNFDLHALSRIDTPILDCRHRVPKSENVFTL